MAAVAAAIAVVVVLRLVVVAKRKVWASKVALEGQEVKVGRRGSKKEQVEKKQGVEVRRGDRNHIEGGNHVYHQPTFCCPSDMSCPFASIRGLRLCRSLVGSGCRTVSFDDCIYENHHPGDPCLYPYLCLYLCHILCLWNDLGLCQGRRNRVD